jgi:hypothetical protein
MSYLTANEAVLNSEIEILADALDQEPEEFENYVGDDDDGTDLEATEGWNGKPLGDEEQWETTVNGFPDTNFDRPVQLSESEHLLGEIAKRDSAIATMQEQQGELALRADPGYQQRTQMARETAIDQIFQNPDQVLDFIDAQYQQNQAVDAARVNLAMNAAAREYGRDFDSAYKTLLSQDRTNPAIRALVTNIWQSPDPGESLMRWHEAVGDLPGIYDGGHSRGRMPPSLNSQSRGYGGAPSRGGGTRSSSRRSDSMPFEEAPDIGGFDPAAEREIMNSVWS